jgi:hypothetical protein
MFQLEIEEDGMNVMVPEVFLGLWRRTVPQISDGEDGRYFESVLIAAPGYGT